MIQLFRLGMRPKPTGVPAMEARESIFSLSNSSIGGSLYPQIDEFSLFSAGLYGAKPVRPSMGGRALLTIFANIRQGLTRLATICGDFYTNLTL